MEGSAPGTAGGGGSAPPVAPPPPPPSVAGPPPPPGQGPPLPPPGGARGVARKGGLGIQSLKSAISGLEKTQKHRARGAAYFKDKSSTGHVGLTNQGATCYMNSLLQSLYMTPEFFNTLFSWKHGPMTMEDVAEAKNIPLQLQRLFTALTFGEKASAGTEALTAAFGWTEADAFTQHDIQELRLVLFEALDKCFSQGGSVDLMDEEGRHVGVKQLFQGITESYVQCLECCTRGGRQEPFLDLQLQTRGITSLEEALDLYMQPDQLDGDNQYMCSTCEGKVDALRGYSLVSLPPILTLQLKRFDYNFETWTRIKLNHRMSFPMALKMNRWAQLEPGTEEYQLHSVLVHKGGAMGGHYYAFIRSAEEKWLRFDDDRVSEATEENVVESFGSGDGTGTAFSGTAYMLVYRRKDLQSDGHKIELVSALLKQEIEQKNVEFLKEKKEFDIRKDTINLQIQPLGEKKSHQVAIYKKKPLRVLLDLIHSAQPPILQGSPALKNVRLRAHDQRANEPGGPLEDLAVNIEEAGVRSGQLLHVEVREEGEDFEEYVPDTSVIVHLIRYLPHPVDAFADSLSLKLTDTSCISLPVIEDMATTALAAAKEDVRLMLMDPETFQVQDLDEGNVGSLHDGATVYAEFWSDVGGSRETSHLHESALSSKRYMIEVLYNRLGERLTSGSLLIDSRKKMRALKEELCARLEVPVRQFKLCTNAISKVEYKDLEKVITDCKIFDGSAVFVQEGLALEVGEYHTRFFLYKMCEDDNNNFDRQSEFAPLTTLIIHESWTTVQLKNELLSALVTRQAQEPDKENCDTQKASSCVTGSDAWGAALEALTRTPEGYRIRWREKLGQRAGRVLEDLKTIKENMQSALQDSTELSVQVVKVDDKALPDRAENILIALRQWKPSTWELSPLKRELCVPRATTIAQLKAFIAASVAGLSDSALRVTKCPLRIRKYQEDKMGIPLLKWEWEPQQTKVTASPWYLKDGQTILFYDAREPFLHELDAGLAQAASGSGREASIRIVTEFD